MIFDFEDYIKFWIAKIKKVIEVTGENSLIHIGGFDETRYFNSTTTFQILKRINSITNGKITVFLWKNLIDSLKMTDSEKTEFSQMKFTPIYSEEKRESWFTHTNIKNFQDDACKKYEIATTDFINPEGKTDPSYFLFCLLNLDADKFNKQNKK